MGLKRIRQTAACLCFVLLTLLFLDFTGTLQGWFGWLAQIQFLPALLALNAGVVVALVVMTLVCGRVYCSVICPLGVFQDVVSRAGEKFKKKQISLFSGPDVAAVRGAGLVRRFARYRPLGWCGRVDGMGRPTRAI